MVLLDLKKFDEMVNRLSGYLLKPDKELMMIRNTLMCCSKSDLSKLKEKDLRYLFTCIFDADEIIVEWTMSMSDLI